jgi:small conductance mechanosensitive channel
MNPYVEQLSSSLSSLGAGFFEFLPRLAVALIVLAVFLPLAALARTATRRYARRRQDNESARYYLALALSRMVQGLVVLLGIFVAVTAAFPTFTPGDLVGALGIGGVAIGFAFKDIFQNFLAGILILVSRPFVVGDQIRFGNSRGRSNTSRRAPPSSPPTTGAG